MKSLTTTLVAMATLASATAANAAIIKPTGAVASSEFSGSYVATNTINGSGLTNPLDINAAHADYAVGNHWTTVRGNPLNAWIDWTFASPTSLSAIYIWNHRSNVIADNPFYAPILFDLTFFDAADNVVALLNDLTLTPNNAFAQSFALPSLTNISRVRFDVEALGGQSSFTGLAEVAFDDAISTQVSEPASLALMIAGLGALGAGLRRRKSSMPA
jgi:hypothetical protein